ncbi:MAG: hypothetical protein IT379_35555 [Deltaproteobacteria bacterium]|nr:hypothetical protein [Deltaproteobacteria bacterium]
MKNKQHYALPVLVGGVVPSILCMIPCVSIGCCLWVALGALVAVMMVQKKAGDAIDMGEGAVIGALCGIIVAAVTTGFGLLLNLIGVGLGGAGAAATVIQQMGGLPPDLRRALEDAGIPQAYAGLLLGSCAGCCMNLIFYGIFGMIGGVGGAAIFKPKPPPAGGAMTPPQGPGGGQAPGGWGQPAQSPQQGGYPQGGGQPGGWPPQGGGQPGGGGGQSW